MKNVAVLGAGVMGLACAYELLKKGYQVEIFEADDRIGGMSAHFDFKGLSIERYYHFICKTDYDLFAYLDEFAIADKLHWVDTRMGYFYDGKLYKWGNPVALLSFPKLDLISKLRYALHAFISTKRSDWSKLDKKEASQWIRQWIGDKAYKVLWEKLFALKFYDYKDNLSAAWIWTRIKRIGTSRKSLMHEQLGYIEGGSETLLNCFQIEIEKLGGKIHLGSPVEEVVTEQNRALGVKIKGELKTFDTVVSTAPLPFVPKLIPALPEEDKTKYENIKNIAVVCVIFKLKQAVTENFWLNVNDERMEIPGVIEFSNLRPTASNIVYVPYYLPQQHPKFRLSDEAFEQEAKACLQIIQPDLADEHIIDIHVSRYRFAQPICPPDFMAGLPPIKSSIDRLYIADTSYYYPEDRSITESVKLGKHIANLLQEV